MLSWILTYVCESVNVADQLRIVNENFFSCVLCVFNFMVYVCHPELWVSWIWTEILGLGRIHVPAGKHLGFRVPMHFLHLGTVPLTWKPGSLDPAPAPDQYGHPVQNSEIFIMSMSLSGWTFTIRQSPTRIKSCWKISGCNFDHQIFPVGI